MSPSPENMTVLGIETSCDETSAAVVKGGKVLSNVISSQLIHSKYGGVVPELASRAHQRLILQVVEEALARGGVRKSDITGVASTQGPGLVGALLVGLSFGKALAFGLGVPFTAVNHMEGHLYSVFLEERVPGYPFVALVVSGGHTMLVHVAAPFSQRLLGQTRDDAAGEAFDKVAKMLGLGYPGGAAIDRLAARGDPSRVKFPRSFPGEGTLDFSFSGIKTSVLYYLRKSGFSDPGPGAPAPEGDLLADICAGFQSAVVEVLVQRAMEAAAQTGVRDIALAGGVSANSSLRRRLAEDASRAGMNVFTPRLEYCMDNAAMIGYVGWMRLARNITSPFETPALARMEIVQEAS
ncbi:MAG TPA: tRNA (adenosine(37)-N6)-threonylcarbamoyltransferase complex transferase subunit TsaD [Bacteroidota bacterium]|nr:tRNA (adenosine(37)-N6)-threonylcarbamoyltransferase complex transferase subunit TsaD [Bacteroidota bacterium]